MDQNRRDFIKNVGWSAAAPLIVGAGGMGVSAVAEAASRSKGDLAGVRLNVSNRFGDFAWRPLVGAFDRDTTYMWPETRFRDLPLFAMWIWGFALRRGWVRLCRNP